MVSVSIKASGKPATQVDFPGKTAEQVTVLDLKKAIRARGIKVSISVSRDTRLGMTDNRDCVFLDRRTSSTSESSGCCRLQGEADSLVRRHPFARQVRDQGIWQ
jgi:hypothetical protein